jgi:hypothetical protein
LADEVTARRTFELNEKDPIVDTISVYVNGQLAEDWSYSEDQNAVIFDSGSEPTEGQTIDIEYATWGCES